MPKITPEYISAASEEHHMAAHGALLKSLGIGEKGLQRIVDLRAHNVATYIADNPDHADYIRKLPEDKQAEEVARLHGELTGWRASPNERTDAHISNRKKKDTSVLGRHFAKGRR